jgi:hypothetical protein
MTALTYTGTESDHSLLLAEGTLDTQDPFDVITFAEVRYRLTKWAILKTRHASFWSGYELGRTDAAAVPKGSWVKSLLRRIGLC